MSADTNGFAAPRPRDSEHTRRAKVAPLLAAGMSERAISAETGIPVVRSTARSDRLEKTVAQGGEKAAAISRELPTSYVVKQDINSVQHDVAA
jgi:hypothetical protein